MSNESAIRTTRDFDPQGAERVPRRSTPRHSSARLVNTGDDVRGHLPRAAAVADDGDGVAVAKPPMTTLLSPLTRAALLSPLTVALLSTPPVAVATLSVPWAFAI